MQRRIPVRRTSPASASSAPSAASEPSAVSSPAPESSAPESSVPASSGTADRIWYRALSPMQAPSRSRGSPETTASSIVFGDVGVSSGIEKSARAISLSVTSGTCRIEGPSSSSGPAVADGVGVPDDVAGGSVSVDGPGSGAQPVSTAPSRNTPRTDAADTRDARWNLMLQR
ncbi:hypothetical protein ELQ94_14370 [Labedella endophytica]|uniref:Uncharacterized protein n=1 Tax=Labedella endophytica TaxID=1523160 RepID=A0A433JQ09_9MICO|nr:hypothetical protein ELQ94_14370 [Labedella endophytica]